MKKRKRLLTETQDKPTNAIEVFEQMISVDDIVAWSTYKTLNLKHNPSTIKCAILSFQTPNS